MRLLCFVCSLAGFWSITIPASNIPTIQTSRKSRTDDTMSATTLSSNSPTKPNTINVNSPSSTVPQMKESSVPVSNSTSKEYSSTAETKTSTVITLPPSAAPEVVTSPAKITATPAIAPDQKTTTSVKSEEFKMLSAPGQNNGNISSTQGSENNTLSENTSTTAASPTATKSEPTASAINPATPVNPGQVTTGLKQLAETSASTWNSTPTIVTVTQAKNDSLQTNSTILQHKSTGGIPQHASTQGTPQKTERTLKNATEATQINATEVTQKNATEGTQKNATEGTQKNATEGTQKNATEGTQKNATEGTLINATEGTPRNATEGTQKNATEGTQTIATKGTLENATERTQENATNGTSKNAIKEPSINASTIAKANIQSEVYCVTESNGQKNFLILNKNTNCKTFQKEKGKMLGDLLCSTLHEEENLKGFNHCEIRLSPAKESQDNRMNIDISFKVDENKINKVLGGLQKQLKELDIQFFTQEPNSERQSASELKKLIAMVVTGSLLLLVFLSAIIYRCSQRKSQHKKEPYLTEEMRAVDNGCHDNPALDITERQSEMQEKKPNSRANTDSWIVPMDNLTKEELEEEDTHL
ncbi:podocalyxin [Heptranchias perlo]|uniref:podocalyxin n=1 Tax=Heptranchias perlo TaxID=212740 RepID=UPI00355A9592